MTLFTSRYVLRTSYRESLYFLIKYKKERFHLDLQKHERPPDWAAPVATASAATQGRYGGHRQCCQPLAKLFGQSGGKIRPLRKKPGPY
jgi:hypothetical protein